MVDTCVCWCERVFMIMVAMMMLPLLLLYLNERADLNQLLAFGACNRGWRRRRSIFRLLPPSLTSTLPSNETCARVQRCKQRATAVLPSRPPNSSPGSRQEQLLEEGNFLKPSGSL